MGGSEQVFPARVLQGNVLLITPESRGNAIENVLDLLERVELVGMSRQDVGAGGVHGDGEDERRVSVVLGAEDVTGVDVLRHPVEVEDDRAAAADLRHLLLWGALSKCRHAMKK